MKSRITSWLGASALLLTLPGAALAAPSHVTYTGELIADNGLPYTGSVDVMARLYGAASGGTAVWAQDLGAVSVMGGVLQADLMGEGLMAALAASSDLWLEFDIDGETLAPRQKLSSAPYAVIAGDAAALGGIPAGSYITEDTIGDFVEADTLPTDGINQVSNGALVNAFPNEQRQWTDGIDIPDFDPFVPGPPAIATFLTGEGVGSYFTSLIIYTQYSVTQGPTQQMRMTLTPPPASGVAPIVLVNGAIPTGVHAQAWSPGNVPELQGLLGNPAGGQWTLLIENLDDSVFGSAPVGTLDSFSIIYDVIRADHMQVKGQLDVAGDLNVDGSVRVGTGGTCSGGADLGRLRVQGGELEFCDGAQWSLVTPRAGRIALSHFEIDSTTRNFSTSWADGRTWTEHTLPGGTILHVNAHVAARNDSSSWGGCYTMLQVSVNGGSWVTLGDSGYGTVMTNGTSHIGTGHYTFHYDPNQSGPFTVQFRNRHRSYDGTCTINGSHGISGGSIGFGYTNLSLLAIYK